MSEHFVHPTCFKFGIALEWGSRGLEFESRHSDHKNRKSICSFGFYLSMERFEKSNATARWTVACRRLEVGNSLIWILIGNPNITNLDTRTMKYSKKFSPQLAYALLWAAIIPHDNNQNSTTSGAAVKEEKVATALRK